MTQTEFKHRIRISKTDITGEFPLEYALQDIKGIGRAMAKAILRITKLDGKQQAGYLSDEDVQKIEEVLNVYSKICGDFDVELILPIRYIKEGKKIKEIIGEEWEQGEKQFSCVFSGNYRDKDGKVIFEK